MKQKQMTILLAGAMLLTLCGCMRENRGKNTVMQQQVSETLETAGVPVLETVPADGNPDNVTCKGSYTGNVREDTVVATVGDEQLTNGQLQSWYWAAVAQYAQSPNAESPDFERPLDVQLCQEDKSVNSWQQYFLKRALNAWHTAQALRQQAQTTPLTTESAYIPNRDTHENCMTGMPATEFLYGYDETYAVNSMHQRFLDEIPAMLEHLAREKGYPGAADMARAAGSSPEELTEFVYLYNYAYTYLTFLSYELHPTLEELEAWFRQNQENYASAGIHENSGNYIDIRQVLLIPEDQSEAGWAACETEALSLLSQWEHHFRKSEWSFAEMAQKHSKDTGTAASGGAYRKIEQGRLPKALEEWCFAPERASGDTAVISTEQGVHILYFSGSTPRWQAQAEVDLLGDMEQKIIASAKDQHPMTVDYSAIALSQAEGCLSFEDVLYPDIAHERYPEVPVYLQQDYPYTYFGNHKISSHGCGITTFSMLATYMSDEEWTPPEMCDLYGKYSSAQGTDGMIFINEPSKFGFFFRERVFEPAKAMAALEEGNIVVSIQHVGYWTRAAHYILLEKLTEDGQIQVRDSNIANYSRIPQHKEDKHSWGNIINASPGYWVFEKKVTAIGACSRCGTPDPQTNLLQSGYLCEKCSNALIRRNTYLSQ